MFCCHRLFELRGPVWAVGSYSTRQLARGNSTNPHVINLVTKWMYGSVSSLRLEHVRSSLIGGQEESELPGVPQLVGHGVLGVQNAQRRVHRAARGDAELVRHRHHRVDLAVHGEQSLRGLFKEMYVFSHQQIRGM